MGFLMAGDIPVPACPVALSSWRMPELTAKIAAEFLAAWCTFSKPMPMLTGKNPARKKFAKKLLTAFTAGKVKVQFRKFSLSL